MEALLRDVRVSARSLLRTPAFTIAAVLTLALGIGANTAIFSAVHGVLLRPLPYPDGDHLAVVWITNEQEGIDRDVFSYPNFTDVREQAVLLSGLAGLTGRAATFSEGEGEGVEEVVGAAVTADFFGVLGVRPALGRTFGTAEIDEGRADLIVLSHGLWTRRFGGDPSIVGSPIRVGIGTSEVVGVMPQGFAYPAGTEYWEPLVPTEGAQFFENRGIFWLSTIARLTPNASFQQANVELGGIMDRLGAEYPQETEGLGVWAEPLRETIVGDVRPALLVLLGAVGFVLLIACANVANLLLARGAARQKEMAVRSALGASGRRLAGQVLTESLVLAGIGGAAGVIVAYWGTSALVAASPADLPRVEHVGVNAVVVAFAALIAALTGVFFGIAPALQARAASLGSVLREGGRGGTGDRVGKLRPMLITLQVALALVLLVGAGLLLRSFATLQSTDPGFRTENVLSFRLTTPGARYPGAESIREFRREFAERLEAMPDVEAVHGISTLFLERLPNMAPVQIEGRALEGADQQASVTSDLVDPGFFAALGVPIVQGRDFGSEDAVGGVPVAIVNETFVRRYFPGEDPLGRRFSWTGTEEYTIVGVVADTRRSGIAEPIRAEGYTSTTQSLNRSMEYVVTTGRDPLTIVPAMRAVLRDMDPSLPIVQLRTVDRAMAETIATSRFIMLLLAGFAGVAVTLAAIGIYGVLAYLVGQRTREIGIRLALGAVGRDVLALVLADSMKSVVAGVLLGIAGALALTRLLEAQLHGISPTDPATFVAVTVLLLAIALLASAVPARRASNVEPMVTLRDE
jgi:putative ABC transport system permease protein